MICLQFCLKINHANVKEKNNFTPTICAGISRKKSWKCANILRLLPREQACFHSLQKFEFVNKNKKDHDNKNS